MVEDQGRRCFVRVGADIPVHGIMRAHEAQASAAAAACGLAPPLLHVVPGNHAGSPGALVFAYVEGRTLRRPTCATVRCSRACGGEQGVQIDLTSVERDRHRPRAGPARHQRIQVEGQGVTSSSSGDSNVSAAVCRRSPAPFPSTNWLP